MGISNQEKFIIIIKWLFFPVALSFLPTRLVNRLSFYVSLSPLFFRLSPPLPFLSRCVTLRKKRIAEYWSLLREKMLRQETERPKRRLPSRFFFFLFSYMSYSIKHERTGFVVVGVSRLPHAKAYEHNSRSRNYKMEEKLTRNRRREE